jgi:hypothetical protein
LGPAPCTERPQAYRESGGLSLTESLRGRGTNAPHRLHDAALRWADRSAGAHEPVTHIPFLDQNVVEYARRIPRHLKLPLEPQTIEKWILRLALANTSNCISDAELARERGLPNGWTLNSKEELMTCRAFKEQFGRPRDLPWMGRTKGTARH